MDKLKLIHNKDKFLLEINDTPVNFVTGYKIESRVDGIMQLTLEMSIDMDKSSIDIENEETNLK